MYPKCFGLERTIGGDGVDRIAPARDRWYNPHMHFAIDWQRDFEDVTKILIAYLLVLPVGWYREREAHSVGVRTFPVVAMASCGYVLLGSQSAHMGLEAQSRIIQGLVAGIGFIGGGAILKSDSRVHGVATAASIWNTGVVGTAVALDRYLLAAVLAALNLFALRVLLQVKNRLDQDPPKKEDQD
jgi:putative Mg2+ transporter-C (MgtC) family protein